MIVEVEMNAFAGGAIRRVAIPDEEIVGRPDKEILGLAFYWGQNDFQPLNLPSVSVGDVVRLKGRRYQVAPVGFREVPVAQEAT